MKSELPSPAHFEQLRQLVTEDDLDKAGTVYGPDPEAHVENIRSFADAGYDHVAVHQVDPDVDRIFRLYEDEVLPEFG